MNRELGDDAPIVEEEKVVEQFPLRPSEPDWELWYRIHPSACQHIKTRYGHCERCGTCIDPSSCAIHSQLQMIYDYPEDFHPVTILATLRPYAEWVFSLLTGWMVPL